MENTRRSSKGGASLSVTGDSKGKLEANGGQRWFEPCGIESLRGEKLHRGNNGDAGIGASDFSGPKQFGSEQCDGLGEFYD